jgi:hypothetical protein
MEDEWDEDNCIGTVGRHSCIWPFLHSTIADHADSFRTSSRLSSTSIQGCFGSFQVMSDRFLLHVVLAAWQRRRDRRRGDLLYTTAVKLSFSLGWKNECMVLHGKIVFRGEYY